MASTPEINSALFVALAEARLRQLSQSSASIADRLDLPPEDKYTVLAAMASRVPAPVSVPDDATNRRDVYGLAHDLVSDPSRNSLLGENTPPVFEEIWSTLAQTPLRAVADFYGHLDLDQANLPNAPMYETLLALISLISWAVLESATPTGQPSSERVVEEGESRGMTVDLATAVATHIADGLRFQNLYMNRLQDLPGYNPESALDDPS